MCEVMFLLQLFFPVKTSLGLKTVQLSLKEICIEENHRIMEHISNYTQ